MFAGETEAVHPHTLKKCFEQYCVPVEGQADILVAGIPYISPYNVNAYLNPLLVQIMAQGYFFNMNRGVPLVKKGGTLIITHPCGDRFDNEQHAPYVESCTVSCPRPATRWSCTSATRPTSRPTPPTSRCTAAATPTTPRPFMWYWGEAGRQHLGRVIVVGPTTPTFLKAPWLRDGEHDARRARHGPRERTHSSPSITLMHCTAHRHGRRGASTRVDGGGVVSEAVVGRLTLDVRAQLAGGAAGGVDRRRDPGFLGKVWLLAAAVPLPPRSARSFSWCAAATGRSPRGSASGPTWLPASSFAPLRALHPGADYEGFLRDRIEVVDADVLPATSAASARSRSPPSTAPSTP